MKRFTFVLLALCGLWLLPLARSQTTTISGLPIISSPSTNTFLEVADMNASPKSRKYLLTNLATVTYVDARPTGFAGIVSNNVASAGLLAVDATKTNGVAATSAMVQTALGQVYQATNANLTGWSAIPATSAGVQATLGQVYQATNSNLTGWSAITADSAGIQSTLGQVYQATNSNLTLLSGYGPATWQATNSTLTTLAGTTTTGTGQIVLSSVTDNKQPLATTLTALSTNTTTGTGRIVLESAAGGGSAPVGTVINSTVSNGLLAVDSTKTNGTAATAAMITNAWGIFDGSTTKFVAGDGTLQTPAAGTVYASNIVSGGQLGMGTLSADTATVGGLYYVKSATTRGISSTVLLTGGTNIAFQTGGAATNHIVGPSDAAFTIKALEPVQKTNSVAGNALYLRASDATAGSSSGYASGGGVTIATGNANNATTPSYGNGGDLLLTTGLNILAAYGHAGNITLAPGGGNGYASGNINLVTADNTAGATTNNGRIYIQTGISRDNGITFKTSIGAHTGYNGGFVDTVLGNGADENATPGNGGRYSVTGGSGGEAANSGAKGGSGSSLTLTAGIGGNGTSSTGGIGGSGGVVTITSGAGGSATGASGTRTGGNSGDIVMNIATNGTGATANGSFGSIKLQAGGTNKFTVSYTNLLSSVPLDISARTEAWTNAPPAGSARLFAATNGAVVEMFVCGDDGTTTQISPHADDAPAALYDMNAGDMKEIIWRETNPFITNGSVSYINMRRMARITELNTRAILALAGNTNTAMVNALQKLKDLTPAQRQVLITETYAEHNTRTGESLVTLNWDAVEQGRQAAYDAERAAVDAKRVSTQQQINLLTGQLASAPDEEKAGIQSQIDSLTASMPAALPEKNVVRSKPTWMK